MLLIPALWFVMAVQQNASPGPTPDMHSGMNERGEKGMGFSQTATTHHFLLSPTGGAIQVEANDPNDKNSRDTILMHLRPFSTRSRPETSTFRCSSTTRSRPVFP